MMQRLSAHQLAIVKIVLFFLLIAPSVYAISRVLLGEIAEPGDYLTHVSGEYALRLLALTLSITPLVTISGWNWLIHLRRMIGLYVFYYALLHLLTYLLLDIQLDYHLVLEDITERTYITIGFTAFLLLLPLAVTSNNYLLKKLGWKRWGRLHRAVYLIAPLVVIHYWWQIKNEDILFALNYALLFAVLLILRYPPLVAKIKRR